ncbi:MAG: glycosyltransferase family 2 protein [Chitinophagaceae bacterium]|nr:MAG: glycosyltransferase family 2 protein [Chitinophagaceae bacterium]
MKLSVVICTYNPNTTIFEKVLEALQKQSLSRNEWELLVIDNCSKPPIDDRVDLSWHPNGRIVVEAKAGLFHARVAGVQNSRTGLIVFADDDNVLTENYLENSYQFSSLHPEVGCFGGRSLPDFETAPPEWFKDAGINLGCQDYGPQQYISNYAATNFSLRQYPEKAPIGTGMVILKKAFNSYLEEAINNPERTQLGRRGKSLSSGEDNDIILSLVKKGFELAYVPSLVVHHLIPATRYQEDYLKRMAFESNRTWVKVLEIHGINPWEKISGFSYGPRKIKSFITYQAWKSPLRAIRWKSACGLFKGLSEL